MALGQMNSQAEPYWRRSPLLTSPCINSSKSNTRQKMNIMMCQI
jgi:hypothetical protein